MKIPTETKMAEMNRAGSLCQMGILKFIFNQIAMFNISLFNSLKYINGKTFYNY